MDFLAEDLDAYEDEQIGAAVRIIHENCKGAMEKYISPKPIFEKQEGEEIEVEEGFDPGMIKLTGNVTGDPPFKGILRHKGWQSKPFKIPELSFKQNPLVIAPAEIEIE